MSSLTVGEHNDLWKMGARSIINSEKRLCRISDSLRRRNGIEILKELHNIHAISEEDYKEALKELLNSEGFTIDIKEEP